MKPWPAVITVLALLVYLATSINVVVNRRKYSLHAPAMSGHPVVERALRVQGNSLEWLVIFLPALWIFCAYWNNYVGAALGLLWCIGRIAYMAGYMIDTPKRGPGFALQGIATLILLIGAGLGAIKALMVEL